MRIHYLKAWGILILLALLMGVMSCGGGKGASRSTLPSLDRNAVTSSTGYEFTEADIPNLSAEVQGYLAHPGWNGPPTSIPPVSGAPMPPTMSVEEFLAIREGLIGESGDLARSEDPVVPVKGSSYAYVPPTDPNYFPALGEYDLADWDPPPPPPGPPFGKDANNNRIEDLFANVDPLGILTYASFVKRGINTPNNFNRGTSVAGAAVSSVYQSIRTELGNLPTGELVYREAENSFLTRPYRVPGMYYKSENLVVKVKRYSDVTDMRWFNIMIAPASEVKTNGGAHYQSIPSSPNETLADYQAWSYDPDKNPFIQTAGLGWEENGSLAGTLMVKLYSSENTNIQKIINDQATQNAPLATFGTFGLLMQRWIDDRGSTLIQPWEGRLGWPLGDPYIDRSGRVIVGPLGQYYRYGQMFEKGFIWWNDYIDPNTPDELYVYMYNKASTLDSGGQYTQDTMVVRYGLGGPLGMGITASPIVANVGDPVYFHAFPYGGPTTNVNGFLDDIFVWNFRDGNYYIGDGTGLTRTHDYFTEAKYTARVMLVLDVDGDGAGDGATPSNVCFADAPEINIGHLGAPGGGGATANICIVDDGATSTVTSLGQTLTALGITYDTKTSAQVTSASVLATYLLTIWCPTWSQYGSSGAVTPTEKQILYNVCSVNNKNLMINWGSPYPYDYYDTTWANFLGSSQYYYPNYNYGYGSGYGIVLTGFPLGTGPGGSISQVNWSINPSNGYEYTWAYLYYYYAMSGVTKWGHGAYDYYWSTWIRDANGAGVNGKMAYFGLNWDHIASTTPAGPGKNGLMQNILNLIDPSLLAAGGPGGLDPVDPYDGPVDIADAFAWVYDRTGGSISGGNGDTALTRAIVSVIGTGNPKTIYYEALARAKKDVNLIYQWEFSPGAGFGTWTKYTSYAYNGGIDPDGPGPALEGDPFPVNVRVYNSSYGSYAAAPAAERDIDSVLVEVHGAMPVDISDDGSTFPGQAFVPDGSNNINFNVNFKIANGIPPYDTVWIDYDYNFVTFTNRVQVTPTPGEGSSVFSLTIPNATRGKDYYIAIRVTDADAPNGMDTYAWTLPAKVAGGKILVVEGEYYATAPANAVKADLAALGNSYYTMSYSSVTSYQSFNGYDLVIWVRGDVYPTSYQNMSTTYQNAISGYIDNLNGNVILMWPGPVYMSGANTMFNRMGVQNCSWWTSGNNPPLYMAIQSNYVPYNGPGGNGVTQLTSSISSYGQPLMLSVGSDLRSGYKGVFGWMSSPTGYLQGIAYDNGTAGDHLGWGMWVGGWGGWDTNNGSTPSTPGRKGVLWNLIEAIDPNYI